MGPVKHFSGGKIAMISASTLASAGGDPQSGPPISPRGLPGFFHYDLQWVLAEEGKIIGLHKSNYINRELQFSVGRNDTDIRFGLEGEIGSVALSEYLNRGEEEQNPELGHHILITRGLPIRTGAELARLLDAKERKKDRTYRRYGGQMPRVACHGILSFPWGITDQGRRRRLDRTRVAHFGRA